MLLKNMAIVRKMCLYFFKFVLTIYAPVIYTRPCIMFWRRGYTLRGEVGKSWALEFPSFLGPVKWHRADRQLSVLVSWSACAQLSPSSYHGVCCFG